MLGMVEIKSSVLDRVDMKCLLDVQVGVSRTQFNI